MLVEVLARTMVEPVAEDYLKNDYDAEDADFLAEFTGRECYQAWGRENPDTAATQDYVQKNLIGKQHFSVIEHASVTFRISEVSRSFTHEMIRHRHMSFSQLSQRYVDVDKMELVVHPTLADEGLGHHLGEVWDLALEKYALLEKELRDRGYKKKPAREAAREVLPNGTGTVIDVTGNHRAWLEFVTKRYTPGADRQIALVAEMILEHLRGIAPAIYDHVPDIDLD